MPDNHAKDAPPVLPSDAFRARARVGSHAAYAELYRHSLEEPLAFWREQTRDLVLRTPISTYVDWKLPHAKFFAGTTLNVSESCLDRHLVTGARNRAAIVWEGEPGEVRTLTYFELHREVVRLAAALTDLGVKAGDRVAIYLGMVPEAAIAMLACARIGAPHTVVFGGFSADALRDRINDCGCKVLLTQDGAYRRGHVVPLKKIADAALEATPSIEKVIMFRRVHDEAKAPTQMREGRDSTGTTLLARPASEASRARADARPRSTPSTRSSSSTPPARRGSRRGSSTRRRATSRGSTSLRSTSSTSRRATSTGARPTSAGSPVTATSSTGRSRAAPRA